MSMGPWHCPECNRLFRYMANLRRHRQTAHGVY